jgi:hypothetical protein
MTIDPRRDIPKWRDLTAADRNEVSRLLSQGQSVSAIRYYRQASGLGLEAAKQAIELLLEYDPPVPIVPETKPCPFCGLPLRNALARQCFECGADWHEESAGAK